MDRGHSKRPAASIKYILAFVLIVAAGVVYKFVIKNNHSGIKLSTSGTEQTLSSESSQVTDTTGSSETEQKIQVYICGEVNEPGIYEVSPGVILNDIVEMAGGFTDIAARDKLDLVYRISDNISLFIPNKKNLDEADPCILRLHGDDVNDGSGGVKSDGKININTADQDNLMTLPGIGESLAKAIISYREDHRFGKIEDIRNVSGIGESKFGKIKDLICV